MRRFLIPALALLGLVLLGNTTTTVIKSVLVSELARQPQRTGLIVQVRDATSSSDCSAGGGSDRAICVCDSVSGGVCSWESMGGGGAVTEVATSAALGACLTKGDVAVHCRAIAEIDLGADEWFEIPATTTQVVLDAGTGGRIISTGAGAAHEILQIDLSAWPQPGKGQTFILGPLEVVYSASATDEIAIAIIGSDGDNSEFVFNDVTVPQTNVGGTEQAVKAYRCSDAAGCSTSHSPNYEFRGGRYVGGGIVLDMFKMYRAHFRMDATHVECIGDGTAANNPGLWIDAGATGGGDSQRDGNITITGLHQKDCGQLRLDGLYGAFVDGTFESPGDGTENAPHILIDTPSGRASPITIHYRITNGQDSDTSSGEVVQFANSATTSVLELHVYDQIGIFSSSGGSELVEKSGAGFILDNYRLSYQGSNTNGPTQIDPLLVLGANIMASVRIAGFHTMQAVFEMDGRTWMWGVDDVIAGGTASGPAELRPRGLFAASPTISVTTNNRCAPWNNSTSVSCSFASQIHAGLPIDPDLPWRLRNYRMQLDSTNLTGLDQVGDSVVIDLIACNDWWVVQGAGAHNAACRVVHTWTMDQGDPAQQNFENFDIWQEVHPVSNGDEVLLLRADPSLNTNTGTALGGTFAMRFEAVLDQ